ncbi:MAG: hypothetical protein U9P71_01080 [Campylobacterota bacterium]|nr:hypothetical protein [Campylobacterota bacterium]
MERLELIDQYGEDTVISAEALEYGNLENNVILIDIIDSAYNGNWSVATKDYRELNLWGREFQDFIEALEENGDSQAIKTLAEIGFYSREGK